VVSPRWQKIGRDLGSHWGRTAVVVAAIALGMIGAGSVLDTWSILDQALSAWYRATNPPSATLVVESLDREIVEEVEGMAGVAMAQAERHVRGRVRVEADWLPLQIFSLADFDGHRVGLLEPSSGAWPPRDGELVIEQSSLPFARVGPGDEVAVALGDALPRSLPIAGVVRDAGLAPGWMEHVVYAFATPATLQTLGVSPDMDRLEIVVADDALDEDHIRRVAFDVKARLESSGRVVHDVWVPTPGEHIHAGQMNSLLYVQGAFGVLAFVLSGFLVLNLMTAILAGQVREIGVMKAVGARTSQVAGVYLGLALLMGLVSAALAMPVAAALGRAYAAFAANMLNFDVSAYAPRPSMFWLQLGVGALLPVGAALVPVVRGARVTVSEALRDYGIAESRFGHAASDRLLSRVSGPTRPLLLSLRNTFRRRGRLALTLVALAMGGGVLLGALNLRTAIKLTFSTMFDAIAYDISVVFSESHPTARIEQLLAESPDVVGAEAWTGASAALVFEDGTQGNRFPIVGLPPGSALVDFPIVAGRWLEESDTRALVVTRQFVELEPRVAVGSTVNLSIFGDASDWQVVGMIGSWSPQPLAYAARAHLATAASTPGQASRAAVALTSDADPGAVFDRLVASLGAEGVDVSSGGLLQTQREVAEAHLLMVSDFLLAMALLIIVVGGLGLATTLNLAVLERTREIGVMRAIGARHHTIHLIVLAEGLCIGLISYGLALPLSVPMSAVVGNGFGRIMFKMPVIFTVSPGALAAWLVIVLLLSAAASLDAARRATRLTTAAALDYA
jgi:putative ABC transport system permease protein